MLPMFSNVARRGVGRAIAAAEAYRDVVMADSPAAYWRMADGTDELGGYELSPSASGITIVGGVLGAGQASNFDGVGGYYWGSSPLPTSGELTLELWCRPAPGSQNALMAYAGDSSTSGFGLLMGDGACGSGSNLVLLFGGIVCDAIGAGVAISTGDWHHAAVTYDTSFWRLYLDGAEIGSVDGSSYSPNVWANSFGVGATGAGNGLFAGDIDEVAAYTSALSAARILAHYNAGIGA